MTWSAWGDERVESIIGALLRAGVSMAAAIVAAGGIFYLVRYGLDSVHYAVFNGEPCDLRNAGGIARGAFSFHPRDIIQLGLLFLIATPVARVAFSVVAFALQRDRTYVIITLIVLGVLLYSVTRGVHGA